jgi:RNA recognition motif-containing protein
MNIFVAKLSGSTTSDDLLDAFAQYGDVTSAKVIIDRETGRSKCFGFVEMSNDEEARNAINQLDNATFNDSTIVVKEARPKEDRGGSGFRPRGEGGFRPRNEGGYRPREDRGGYNNRY